MNKEPRLSHYCDAIVKHDVDIDMLLKRFNEKRIEDFAKTLGMLFGHQIFFVDLIMNAKEISANLIDNSVTSQVNSIKATSTSEVNIQPNQSQIMQRNQLKTILR